MYDIVVTEFVDQWAVDDLAKDYKVHYDPKLVDKPEEIAKLAAESPAIVVRNRTQVRGATLAALRQHGWRMETAQGPVTAPVRASDSAS